MPDPIIVFKMRNIVAHLELWITTEMLTILVMLTLLL